ncbi:hypothetical protein Ancab_025175, partial [Ancistrocladus abbreviatus]
SNGGTAEEEASSSKSRTTERRKRKTRARSLELDCLKWKRNTRARSLELDCLKWKRKTEFGGFCSDGFCSKVLHLEEEAVPPSYLLLQSTATQHSSRRSTQQSADSARQSGLGIGTPVSAVTYGKPFSSFHILQPFDL